MAIGFAGLLGYELCRNFDFPYFSRNVREFWRRWHISLSTWLRDYLYISLGGGRATPLGVHRNVMITMLLGGLWHGAATTFVLWGFLHGLALIVYREWSERTRNLRFSLPAGEALGVVFTFAWVAVCFTIFRASDMTTATEFLSAT
jgi:alginate O-acetyltransferase complex protein AlgI